MKTIKILLSFVAINMCTTIFSQISEKGNVNLHIGTIIYYNTFSLGYESKSLLKSNRHQLRTNVRLGMWTSSIFDKNKGSLTSLGGTYLFGNKHYIEFSSEVVFHFDRGLKGQTLSYIGTTYRPFLGYRWENPERKILTRIGFGWYEVVQIGIGYKI